MHQRGKQGLITLVYLQRSLLQLLITSDDGSKLNRNPLQVLLLCVGRLLSCMLRQSRGRGLHKCTSACACACAFACVRACLPACVHGCVCVCVCVSVCVHLRFLGLVIAAACAFYLSHYGHTSSNRSSVCRPDLWHFTLHENLKLE